MPNVPDNGGWCPWGWLDGSHNDALATAVFTESDVPSLLITYFNVWSFLSLFRYRRHIKLPLHAAEFLSKQRTDAKPSAIQARLVMAEVRRRKTELNAFLKFGNSFNRLVQVCIGHGVLWCRGRLRAQLELAWALLNMGNERRMIGFVKRGHHLLAPLEKRR